MVAQEKNNAPATELATRPQAIPRGIMLASVPDAEHVALRLSRTRAIPECYQGKPDECFAAIMLGVEVGMPPLQALRSIMVVNGRATIWGDALLGLCQRSPVFDHERFKETLTGDGEKMVATCTVARKGGPTVTRTFSMADAKRAGLTAKKGSLYQFYPQRMLPARARTFALRDTFSDVLMGFHATEEYMDDPRFVDSAPTELPKPVTAEQQTAAIGVFAEMKVSEATILAYLGRSAVADMDGDDLDRLRTAWNRITSGVVTAEQEFSSQTLNPDPVAQAEAVAAAMESPEKSVDALPE